MDLLRRVSEWLDRRTQRDVYLTEPWQGVEIIPPRELPNSLAATATWLSALHARGSAVNLEIVQEPQRVSLRVCAPVETFPQVVASARRAFPLADFRHLQPSSHSVAQAVATCELRLASTPYLPLATFDDKEEYPVDPLCGLCTLSDDLAAGERVSAQILLEPAAGWPPRDTLRPRKTEPQPNEPALLVFFGGCFVLACAIFIMTHNPNAFGYLIIGALTVALLGGICWYYANAPFPFQIDPVLVEEKVQSVGFVTTIRLSAVSESGSHARILLDTLVAGYGQFNRGRGNRLQAHALAEPDPSRRPVHRPFWQPEHILSAQELAALWHLPLQAGDVPHLDGITYRPANHPHQVSGV